MNALQYYKRYCDLRTELIGAWVVDGAGRNALVAGSRWNVDSRLELKLYPPDQPCPGVRLKPDREGLVFSTLADIETFGNEYSWYAFAEDCTVVNPPAGVTP